MKAMEIWDYKSWAGTAVTAIAGYFSKAPTLTDIQYAAGCVAILSGLLTIAYTLHKWYKSIKEK